jgi:transcriptional regulator of arginine metabolism
MTVDQTILELIDAQTVTDQASLLELLTQRGHQLTQPTLSRHLKKLSVMKVNGRYQRVERSAPERPPWSLIESPPNLLTLNTAPGHAPLLGVIVDRAGIEGIAGTLAGDDAVFIALAGGVDISRVRLEIEAALNA